ncbi:hypothetical protein [Leptolyngbya sp. FACHB-261]|uniref:hypothetical protein n=1 Tax=Leptolyngbya sp. FACHB-261 TaxID=2692806 RepID=UPI0016861DD7|nr:hypothetical protein [Leptolyngbya sp. FACHB-261]MBD2100507.1 hypothetical protein [Leptolyngbya sp. FACHB-261]
MSRPLSPQCSDSLSDPETWESLKRVIFSSSGFSRWHQERLGHQGIDPNTLPDELVRSYLRETLETLAY